MAQHLQEHFTLLLHKTAMSACGLSSIPTGRSVPSVVLQCAHDAIMDPSTQKKMAPHFIVDCTDACKIIADIAAKEMFNDKEKELYQVLATEATKHAKNTASKKSKAEKNVSKAEKQRKKAEQKVKKAGASGGKAAVKAQKAVDTAVKKLEKASKELDQANKVAAQAKTNADAAAQKAKKAVEMQTDIIQCWRGVLDSRTTAKPHPSGVTAAMLEQVESYFLWLPPCPKCEGQCQCT